MYLHYDRYSSLEIFRQKVISSWYQLSFYQTVFQGFSGIMSCTVGNTELPRRSSRGNNVKELTNERITCGKPIYRPDSSIYRAEIATVFITITAKVTPLNRQWKLLTFMLLYSQLVKGSSISLAQALLVMPSVAVSAAVAVVFAKRSETLGVVAVTTQWTNRVSRLPANKAYQ